jgi:hypothetical protein
MVTKDPKRSHGFGNTVGYVECLYGHIVTEDPQRSYGFGNFLLFILNVHGNMVMKDLMVLRIL